ncbi:MAG: hypothetical protein KME60_14675 [Cyanomargarita calcarea GSE-NOS-MK-12-04C]|jgi:hypothetical protein|uniref:Uncharacterized protein n=1 Tax=Cyanomargarita calcarea GSE-NOS-MK-12-04C TaxID=2839659 RepID=A0A951QMS8_9CYAN|nr:hypothetical protein [Cyanomargarita calcarea GSE-NOS-MK-12-04C]
MAIFTNFLRSLLLTIIFSFVAPMFIVGGLLLTASLIGYIPNQQGISEAIAWRVMQFLATFGSGIPLHGILVISLTCGFVGALFDMYAYYRGHILRIDS